MFTGSSKNARSTLILCGVLIGLGSVIGIKSLGQIFSLPGGGSGKVGGKSLGELARRKIADLHSMRNQLENNNNHNKRVKTTTTTNNKILFHHPVDDGNFTHKNNVQKKITTTTTHYEEEDKSRQKLEERIGFKMPSMWDSLRSVFSMKRTRDGFLTRILPNSQALLKIIKMRNEMDPNLRDYLTSKYNNLLTKLVPFGDGIGIPSYVLNSMKISQNQDLHWYYIQKILETTSVTNLIQSIPDFSSAATIITTTTPSSLFLDFFLTNDKTKNHNNYPNNVDKNSLSYYEPIQSRLVGDDEMLVSDQEPDATIKGHKKKYTSYGIRLANSRNRHNNRPTKGDLAASASLAGSSSSSSSASANVLGPDRTGYEYSSYADQYGLYGHDSYDTYGKGHDDYSGGGGHSGGGHKGGGGYGGGHGHGHSGGGHKGGGYGGTGKGHSGHSSSYGHSTYYSPKSYGHSGGGYSSGYGHSGGGYSSYGGGGGHGHGMGGYGMNAFLDPFSILGTLAFLTYLGLLFQRSMTPTMMVNGTGRAFHGRNLDPVFGWEQQQNQRQPVQLTVLNFDKEAEGDSDVQEGDEPDRALQQHTRQIRSLETFFQEENNNEDDLDLDGVRRSPGILEETWKEIVSITNIDEMTCRQMKLCYIVQDIGQTYLLNVFKEALEKREVDRKFLRSLYNQTDSRVGLTCGDFELSVDCNHSNIDYQDL